MRVWASGQQYHLSVNRGSTWQHARVVGCIRTCGATHDHELPLWSLMPSTDARVTLFAVVYGDTLRCVAHMNGLMLADGMQLP